VAQPPTRKQRNKHCEYLGLQANLRANSSPQTRQTLKHDCKEMQRTEPVPTSSLNALDIDFGNRYCIYRVADSYGDTTTHDVFALLCAYIPTWGIMIHSICVSLFCYGAGTPWFAGFLTFETLVFLGGPLTICTQSISTCVYIPRNHGRVCTSPFLGY